MSEIKPGELVVVRSKLGLSSSLDNLHGSTFYEMWLGSDDILFILDSKKSENVYSEALCILTRLGVVWTWSGTLAFAKRPEL